MLANNREEQRQAWLSGLREEVTVENLLAGAQGEATGGAGGAQEGASPGASDNPEAEGEAADDAADEVTGSASEGDAEGDAGGLEEQVDVPNDTELVPAEEGTREEAPQDGQ